MKIHCVQAETTFLVTSITLLEFQFAQQTLQFWCFSQPFQHAQCNYSPLPCRISGGCSFQPVPDHTLTWGFLGLPSWHINIQRWRTKIEPLQICNSIFLKAFNRITCITTNPLNNHLWKNIKSSSCANGTKRIGKHPSHRQMICHYCLTLPQQHQVLPPQDANLGHGSAITSPQAHSQEAGTRGKRCTCLQWDILGNENQNHDNNHIQYLSLLC